MTLPAFKAYDIRGRVPDELDEDLARRIGVALADQLGPGPVVLGHDVRLSSPALQAALSLGLRGKGREVIDIGLCGTEEVYFQVDHPGAAGGVMVTASHNPMDYNGMKLVKAQARPISSDTGLFAISDAAEADTAPAAAARAGERAHPDKSAFVAHLLSYVDASALRPLKLVVNAGNGGAGTIVDLLAPHLPFEFVRVFHEPDGSFPNGIPNPLLPDNRQATADAVREHGADFGIAWDGDFDRCFFFDEQGRFIEGYYLGRPAGPGDPYQEARRQGCARPATGVEHGRTGRAGRRHPGAVQERPCLHQGKDARRGRGLRRRDERAPLLPRVRLCRFGNDSLAADRQPGLDQRPQPGDLVEDRVRKFPCSGEINFRVADAKAAVARVLDHYAPLRPTLDHTDGLSADFGDWRFNLRSSNTEPLLRLNVETRGDAGLLEVRTRELGGLVRGD